MKKGMHSCFHRKIFWRFYVYQEIFKGGMPDICANNSDREAYFKSYVNTYIEKDVRKLISASNETQFRNFFLLLH